MGNKRYDNNADSYGQTGLKLLYISLSEYGSDWHSTLHAHNCMELFYVISGHGEFQVEELHFSVENNDIVIINPGVEHTETAFPENPMEYIVLGIEGGEFLLDDSSDSRYCAFCCDEIGQELLSYMQVITRELEHPAAYADSIVNNLLEVLSFKLLRHKAASIALQPASKSSRECNHIKRYIETHFKETITLDDLAAIVYLNKYSLAHAFTREYNISPINYLNLKRIEESCHLLTNTNYSISQIAQLLGFSSTNYFSQRFTRHEGVSPREYRKLHR